MNYKKFLVTPGQRVSLDHYDPASTGDFKEKSEAQEKLSQDIEHMAELQDVLYAAQDHALLIIFQAMDTAGKDGAIKHVMSGVNPQGVLVTGFKQPTQEELQHDYLWRAAKALPGRGYIGIFNRSYYEEVLVARVHTDILQGEKVPEDQELKQVWKERYEDINNFEQHLHRNNTEILKLFLNVSREEQRQRLLERLEEPDKHWKFSSADLHERAYWKQYRRAYEEMLRHTSTEIAPWYVVPADHKWFTRALVAELIVGKLKSLDLKYPAVPEAMKRELELARKALSEKGGAMGKNADRPVKKAK